MCSGIFFNVLCSLVCWAPYNESASWANRLNQRFLVHSPFLGELSDSDPPATLRPSCSKAINSFIQFRSQIAERIMPKIWVFVTLCEPGTMLLFLNFFLVHIPLAEAGPDVMETSTHVAVIGSIFMHVVDLALRFYSGAIKAEMLEAVEIDNEEKGMRGKLEEKFKNSLELQVEKEDHSGSIVLGKNENADGLPRKEQIEAALRNGMSKREREYVQSLARKNNKSPSGKHAFFPVKGLLGRANSKRKVLTVAGGGSPRSGAGFRRLSPTPPPRDSVEDQGAMEEREDETSAPCEAANPALSCV